MSDAMRIGGEDAVEPQVVEILVDIFTSEPPSGSVRQVPQNNHVGCVENGVDVGSGARTMTRPRMELMARIGESQQECRFQVTTR